MRVDNYSAVQAAPSGASFAGTISTTGRQVAGHGNATRLNEQYLALDDFEPAARRRLPRPLFGYLNGGAERNSSLRANRESFLRYAFVTRVLRDVAKRETRTTLFGQEYSAPFGIAPMGIAALMAHRGDLALASAAKAANIPMIVSGASLTRLEDVVAENPDAWFQAYLHSDTANILLMLDRVRSAGYRTLVITVDSAAAANRENNFRAGFKTPLRPSLRLAFDGLVRPRWLVSTFARTLLESGMPHFENSSHERGAPVISSKAVRDFSQRGRLNWNHIKLIRDHWRGLLIIKGVLAADDARMAQEYGVDGVIVSNHGGRQLDGAVAPLVVLPEIVRSAPGVTVMIDGGVTRGADILKALALGAKFVFVGRPFLYAAAVEGAAGVAHAADLLRREIDRNLGLLGCTGLDQIGPDCLRLTPELAAG